MSRAVEFHPLALRELHEAAQYYEHETKSLGGAFVTEVERCAEAISLAPEAGQAIVGPIRRRLVLRFPGRWTRS